MSRWIHELPGWPTLTWQNDQVAAMLSDVRLAQGKLLGRMAALGFRARADAQLASVTADVLKSSEIEGELLDARQVRSSVARRLGLDAGGLVPSERRVDGVATRAHP
jgi:Fic family protein